MSGGPHGAQSGKLALWVGGERAAFDRHRGLLGAIGDRVWLDENGDGAQNAGEMGIPYLLVTLTGDTLFVGDVGCPDLRVALGWSASGASAAPAQRRAPARISVGSSVYHPKPAAVEVTANQPAAPETACE